MDCWDVDVYRYVTEPSYLRPRKIVDGLKLDWLDDIGSIYYSPEVVFFTKEDIQEKSGWTEEEVRLLFFDKRFPSTDFGKRKVVEAHALIQFFAKKESYLRMIELWTERYAERLTQLRNL